MIRRASLIALSISVCLTAFSAAAQDDGSDGNPAATNIVVGSGWLGEYLGINRNGWRFAGIQITDSNGQFTGGINPGSWPSDTLTIVDLTINTEKFVGWEGGLFGTDFLYYSGGPVNFDAGTVMGYNSLDAAPPNTRVELYELWYRQVMFNDKVVIRIGKSIPTYDFNNVERPVPFTSEANNIPGISSAILTPLYVSPTQLGIMPGYYDSATGVVAKYLPNENIYAEYGFFDGNLAAGRNTGLTGPLFNGYYLHLAEIGGSWTVGPEDKPGSIGFGYWRQTGRLTVPNGGGTVQGADGIYFFASHRIYNENPGVTNNGFTSYFQFAATNTPVVDTQRYFGCGITYFGPVPNRDVDSLGLSFAYGKMRSVPTLGPREMIYTAYYQYQIRENFFFQPNVTFIGQPAAQPGLSDVLAMTCRVILSF